MPLSSGDDLYGAQLEKPKVRLCLGSLIGRWILPMVHRSSSSTSIRDLIRRLHNQSNLKPASIPLVGKSGIAKNSRDQQSQPQ
ncbi:hypothetical protein MRB53_032709 [Persea americana]|uniref:Uncharacterized protein n=1 Tax=Persea americana TaxID=3435 RepID=A0ACC2KTV4_PERAE|nr:hypothetical protein MRB53_032709 [Persea americana]